jgi:flagellar protein FlbD
MIYVTRLNHTPIVLNAELIEHIETTPDTVISLTTGQKFMVLESTEEVIRRVMEFKKAVMTPLFDSLEDRIRNGNCLAEVPKDESYGRQ